MRVSSLGVGAGVVDPLAAAPGFVDPLAAAPGLCRVDKKSAPGDGLRVNAAAFWAKTAHFLTALTKKRPLAALCVSTRLVAWRPAAALCVSTRLVAWRPAAGLALAIVAMTACTAPAERPVQMEYASWFRVLDSTRVVVLSPAGGADTLQGQVRSLVCMSSSYVGFLEALGADSVATAVSGLAFLGNARVQASALEAGYDAALDYEAILRAQPDLLLTYAVGGTDPLYLAKLRELGVRPVVLSEHLESHPLARAEYIKLFGVLTGRLARADSLFAAVRNRYRALARPETSCKVLLNIPYADSWYIPGGDNYMTRLLRDAGAEVLGAVPGRQESSVISLETAYQYALEADFWLHPGWCRTKAQLRAVHPLFASFPVLDRPVWNNTLQATPGGGNRYWETGPVRPDLILEDLVRLFAPDGPGTPAGPGAPDGPFHYYEPVN